MPRREQVRRIAVAALVPLVLTAATACGGDDSDSSSPSSPTVASGTSSPSEASPSASPTPANGTPVDRDRFMKMFTAAFAKATTAHLTMSVTGEQQSMEAEGDVDYSSDPPDVAVTMGGDRFGEGTEVRLVDGVMYLKTPMFGEKFVRLDLSDPDNPLGEKFGELFDLRTVLDGFRDGLRSVTLVGEEEVDGEQLRHYRVETDPSAAMSQADPSASAPAEMPETVTYDLWFDADGLLRRMQADLGSDDGMMTVVLSDWGEDVTIEPPPAREVRGAPGQA
jgi:hypothetical protein